MTGAITLSGLEAVTAETGLGRVRAFLGGDGAPVALLHGLSAGASTWVEVVDRLRPYYRVVALDLPGHGGSTPPPRGAGIDWYADAVAAALGAFASLPAVVVGHSF